MEKFTMKNFLSWISDLDVIKEWILDAEFLAKAEEQESPVLRAVPSIRTDMQQFMEKHPGDITEEATQKLHDFDMFVYKHIDLAYTAFSEYYWKRSEYAPPKSHWWWWLDDYFEGKSDINPDDLWTKWDRRKRK